MRREIRHYLTTWSSAGRACTATIAAGSIGCCTEIRLHILGLIRFNYTDVQIKFGDFQDFLVHGQLLFLKVAKTQRTLSGINRRCKKSYLIKYNLYLVNCQASAFTQVKCYRSRYTSLKRKCYRVRGSMQTEDEMTINERRKYLKRMKPLYVKASKAERGKLLDQMHEVTGLHRKSLLRLLHASSFARKPRQRQRQSSYGREVEQVILPVWESLDFICAERLTPVLLCTARHLQRFGVLHLTVEVESQLGSISRATVARILSKHRSYRQRLPQKGPQRANQLKREIPMKRIPWDTSEPGHFEVDLVAHCGESTAGEYVSTLQLIDVATGWSERVAVLGKGQQAMERAFRHVLSRLPFPVKELHPDNGSEFLNAHLVRFWKEKVVGVQLSRSRPYHKNDNRFVEQKNDSLVRQYFGTLRLETAAVCEQINEIYELMWLYYNLFQPVLHLVEKTEVQGKTVRKWDQAQTPYARLKATGSLSLEQQRRLDALYEQTNPRQLRQSIYERLDRLWQSASPSTEQVA